MANLLLGTISERAQQLKVAANNLSMAATHLQKQDLKGILIMKNKNAVYLQIFYLNKNENQRENIYYANEKVDK